MITCTFCLFSYNPVSQDPFILQFSDRKQKQNILREQRGTLRMQAVCFCNFLKANCALPVQCDTAAPDGVAVRGKLNQDHTSTFQVVKCHINKRYERIYNQYAINIYSYYLGEIALQLAYLGLFHFHISNYGT